MTAPVLIDSDVLVWLTRGHVGAAQRLHALPAWRISEGTGLYGTLNKIAAPPVWAAQDKALMLRKALGGN